MEARDVLRGHSPAQPASRLTWCLAFLSVFAILIAPAAWNGFPLLQYDTGGYLARWFEGYLVPSRPAAYGLLLAATAHLAFWPVLALQAAVTAWILKLLLDELGLSERPALLVGIVAVLSFGTALPWLASILLTDIFAGLAVLALHLVVFGRTLRSGQRWALTAFVAFAAATHSATLAVVALLSSALVVGAVFARSHLPPAAAWRAAPALVLGVALTLTANFAVAGHFAFTPGGYGILFGRMLQDGIVSRYLADHCPDRRLRLCPFRAELPLDADKFLWGDSVFNRLGRFDGLGEEMREIVLGSLRDYPGRQLEAAVTATVTQLVTVANGEGVNNQLWHTYGIMAHFTPAVVPAARWARQQRGAIDFSAMNRVQVPLGLISAALLPLLILAGWRRPEFAALSRLSTSVAVALLANAFVCGALANPHDRYGARLVWLAPLVLILVPLAASVLQRGTSVPIPKFASARGTFSCELRNQMNTSNINTF